VTPHATLGREHVICPKPISAYISLGLLVFFCFSFFFLVVLGFKLRALTLDRFVTC
jgi:hypothetical protein